MPFCTNCGHENPEGSNFCGQCGSALVPGAARAATPEKVPTGDTTKAMPAMVEERDTDSLTAEDEAAVNALPHGSALLIVQRGANAGSRFLLDTDLVTAGRHQDSDIFLDDISVSRRHATFTRTPGGHRRQGCGQSQWHLRQPGPRRRMPAAQWRRGADR